MSENKITKEQLEKLQEIVGKLNNGQNQLGGLEIQKHKLNHAITQVENELSDFQKELEEKYGKVSVNIQDGTYKPIEEEKVVEPEVVK